MCISIFHEQLSLLQYKKTGTAKPGVTDLRRHQEITRHPPPPPLFPVYIRTLYIIFHHTNPWGRINIHIHTCLHVARADVSPAHTGILYKYICINTPTRTSSLICICREYCTEWFIEDQAFLRSYDSDPGPLFVSLPVSVCRRSSSLQGEGGRGWARSHIIRPRECPALYK